MNHFAKGDLSRGVSFLGPMLILRERLRSTTFIKAIRLREVLPLHGFQSLWKAQQLREIMVNVLIIETSYRKFYRKST